MRNLTFRAHPVRDLCDFSGWKTATGALHLGRRALFVSGHLVL